jgi:hypothetical protein
MENVIETKTNGIDNLKDDISNSDKTEWVYCLVGNVVDKHEFGTDKEIRYGTKHFAPGTKVYCLYKEGWGGTGYEHIVVMGKPRKQYRLIKITIPRKYINNFRLKKVRNRKVIKEVSRYYNWDNIEEVKEEILSFVEYFNESIISNNNEK